jgi:hypothetical protein
MLVRSLRTGIADLANVAPGGVARRLSTNSRGARVMLLLVNRLLPDVLTTVIVRLPGEGREVRDSRELP